MADMRRINSVEFVQNTTNWVGNIMVKGKLDDGRDADVFAYYNDELSFSESELIGKTLSEACDLKHAKDVRYLQS